MSKVEQWAQEQFNTFKNRLCEFLSEFEEEYKSAFMQGYAKGETDEKFRAKQEVADLKAQIEKMKCGGNCKHEYWINTGGCYDQKCRFTGLDCTNCKDKWELKA